MDEFYKMDVFFFVATAAVVVFAIIAAIAAFYMIRILRDVRYISRKAKAESDHLAADIADLRANVRQEGAKLKTFTKFFSGIYKRNKGNK